MTDEFEIPAQVPYPEVVAYKENDDGTNIYIDLSRENVECELENAHKETEVAFLDINMRGIQPK